MHDDLFERRLRAALQFEAARLPFTITAAELERRAAVRGRNHAARRFGLLLAAALGIGLIGVGAFVGGLIDGPVDSTEAPSVPVASAAVPAVLPSLEELGADVAPDRVVLAQARDFPISNQRSEMEIGLAQVDLGTVAGGTSYEIRVACDAEASIEIRIHDGAGDGTTNTQPMTCDGGPHAFGLGTEAGRPTGLTFTAPWTARWRVVVIRTGAAPADVPPGAEPPHLTPRDGEEELIHLEDETVVAGDPSPDLDGTFIQEVGSLPARWSYRVALWCTGSDPMRYIHGDEIDGTFLEGTTTQVPCDGNVHGVRLGYPEINGSRAFVAAKAGTNWSLLVSGEEPPIAIAEDQPGWQLRVGFGPHLSFDAAEAGHSAPGVDGGGPVLIVLACTGAEPIEVTVEVGEAIGDRQETFVADCAPDGVETTMSFEIPASSVHVVYAVPVGTWSALSILLPEPPHE
jgi:hypothetical protein